MNKAVKNILIVINLLMILFSIKWYLKDKEYEPLISIFSQVSALILLFFEGKINSVLNMNKNVKTGLELDVSKGDIINANENEDSEIKIKTRD